MKFADLKNAQLRLMILQFLTTVPEYRANAGELSDMLRHFGHAVPRDLLDTQLAWLDEQGLVVTEAANERLNVAKLTARGEDAAYGRAIIPGVKRPGPEDSL